MHDKSSPAYWMAENIRKWKKEEYPDIEQNPLGEQVTNEPACDIGYEYYGKRGVSSGSQGVEYIECQ